MIRYVVENVRTLLHSVLTILYNVSTNMVIGTRKTDGIETTSCLFGKYTKLCYLTNKHDVFVNILGNNKGYIATSIS